MSVLQCVNVNSVLGSVLQSVLQYVSVNSVLGSVL